MARGRSRHLGPGSISSLELALVTIMLGIAVIVAVPQYMHLRQGGRDDSAKTRLERAAVSLRAHHAAAGTYAGSGLVPNVRLSAAGPGSFCIETKAGSKTWHEQGPRGKPASGSC